MRFCKLDNDGKILNITEVLDSDTQVRNASSDGSYDTPGDFDETVGIKFCEKITGWPSWVAITPERKGRAMIGGMYDKEHDVFVYKKPIGHTSWTFNYSTAKWEAPVAFPSEDLHAKYNWNESNQTWEAWS